MKLVKRRSRVALRCPGCEQDEFTDLEPVPPMSCTDRFKRSVVTCATCGMRFLLIEPEEGVEVV